MNTIDTDIDWASVARMWKEKDMTPANTATFILDDETIKFPATFAGLTQRGSGEIVVKLELDASQLAEVQKLGSDWLDKGLLVAITPSDDEPIAG